MHLKKEKKGKEKVFYDVIGARLMSLFSLSVLRYGPLKLVERLETHRCVNVSFPQLL